MSEINNLPAWARVKQDSRLMWTAGRDFQPGDTLYFNEKAYPRVLWTKLSDSSWAVMEDRGNWHKRGQISIDPHSYYVVKPAGARQAVPLQHAPHLDDFFANRPLTSISVEGEDLAVGDVVYLNANQGRVEILEIGEMRLTARGNARAAKVNFLGQDKVGNYTFSGFRVIPPFLVVAGPKFAAARQDTNRIFWRGGVNRWHWKG